jgi:Leu/Phe-tRNA-protein transferase|tara:strand:- start:348 stop:611 length:264 start_codon:yes stop_codon:yes gene_type:complete
MAKKVETKKITKEELELITNQQQELGQHLKNIGIIEVEKRNIQDKIKVVSDEIEKAKNDLEKKYGSINIDLKDGSYTEVVKEDDKQD